MAGHAWAAGRGTANNPQDHSPTSQNTNMLLMHTINQVAGHAWAVRRGTADYPQDPREQGERVSGHVWPGVFARVKARRGSWF